MRPTIKQLEHLRALQRHGSFSLAAEHCAITQSSLSASIKELETILDQQLVNRSRKAITLTAFGNEVLEQSEEILRHIDTITTRAQSLKAPMSGLLRLGIIPTIAPYMLPEILPTLSTKYPDLELELHEETTENLLALLREGQIDVALLAFPYNTHDLQQKILFEEPFFAAIPENGNIKQTEMRMKDLRPEKLLLLEDGHCLRQHALEACNLQPTKQKKTFRASSLPTLIEMVRHGYGMTLLPEMACKNGSIPTNISIIPFTDDPVPSRQIGLCWHPGSANKQNFEILGQEIKSLSV